MLTRLTKLTRNAGGPAGEESKMECERCGREVDETNNEILYRLGCRDDGTEYEQNDGSFSASDVLVCADCHEEAVGSEW